MRVEKPDDPKFLSHNYAAPWKSKISYETWCSFLQHNFTDPSRQEIYKFFNQYLRINSEEPNKSFLEIGFGQCYDFVNCFKNFHDMGIINYTGWDITEQFVKFANKKYNPDAFFNKAPIKYKFECGGFQHLVEKNFDIIYTRHTLEHQHPSNCYRFFENLLEAVNELIVVCWFQVPGEEVFSWNDRDGFKHEGAYVNKYSSVRLNELIKKHGWNNRIIKSGPPANEIWILTK